MWFRRDIALLYILYGTLRSMVKMRVSKLNHENVSAKKFRLLKNETLSTKHISCDFNPDDWKPTYLIKMNRLPLNYHMAHEILTLNSHLT